MRDLSAVTARAIKVEGPEMSGLMICRIQVPKPGAGSEYWDTKVLLGSTGWSKHRTSRKRNNFKLVVRRSLRPRIPNTIPAADVP